MPDAAKLAHLKKLATLIRYYILNMTTQAGSGHPTSSMSATELMAGLMFGGIFRYDLDNPSTPTTTGSSFPRATPRPCFIPCGRRPAN